MIDFNEVNRLLDEMEDVLARVTAINEGFCKETSYDDWDGI